MADDDDVSGLFAFVSKVQRAVGVLTFSATALDRSSAACRLLDSVPPLTSAESRACLARLLPRLAKGVIVNVRYAHPLAPPHQASRWRAQLACGWLISHFRNADIGLRDLADALGITPPHLCRVLQAESGFPFLSHLRTLRVLEATVQLSDPRLRMKEIAGRTGFHSNAEMDHAFNRTLHMSPTVCRRSLETG